MMPAISLFTAQCADLSTKEVIALSSKIGFEGLELSCKRHFNVRRALKNKSYCKKLRDRLSGAGLSNSIISNHPCGQAVCDKITSRHQGMLPEHVWGSGRRKQVNRRAIEEMKDTARAAEMFGVPVVSGFSGSSIWPLFYRYPPVSQDAIAAGFQLFADRFNPILDVFGKCGVKFALEVHPTEIAFDIDSAEQALGALDGREEFGFTLDPSQLYWQGIDPVEFIRAFPDRIFHVHIKDVKFNASNRYGVLCGHRGFGHPKRGWDFRTPGRGDIDFEAIYCALADIGYQGLLSIEWEDSKMKRKRGLREGFNFTKKLRFPTNATAFDAGPGFLAHR